MKKIKQVFPSRNYITVDSYGDVEVIFNPVGDGFEGDDKLMFRKGRWAFRVNDFLSGKVMADGSKEGMGRKVYSLNLVYDDADGEPIVNTTYVDPTSVIPLDGSVVDVVGSEKLAQEKTLQNVEKNTGDLITVENTLLERTDNIQSDVITIRDNILNRLASESSLVQVDTDINQIKTFLTSDIYNKINGVENSVDAVGSTLDNLFDDDNGFAMRSQIKEIIAKQNELEKLCKDSFISTDDEYLADIVSSFWGLYSQRFRRRTTAIENISGNSRYSSGTVFYFGTTHFIALRSDCITIVVGSEFLLLGDMSEYNNGTVKRLDGVKFAQSDVTKIVS